MWISSDIKQTYFLAWALQARKRPYLSTDLEKALALTLIQVDSHCMEQFFSDVRTSAELGQQGWSSAKITRSCRRGSLYRIRPNVYVQASVWRSWTAQDQCIARHVGFIKTHPLYVLSHISAALWWGAPLLHLPQRIWVSHPKSTVRSSPEVHLSRKRPTVCAEATFEQGAYITLPLQTALDCALTLPLPEALCIVDYLLHQQLVEASSFLQALEGKSSRGIRNARQVGRLMSALAESPAETLARYRIKTWGFADPQEQASLWVEGRVYRPDFLWEKERVILEVDGGVKYSGAYGDPGQVIQREKRRQRDLEKLGYRVVRVLWEDLVYRPENLRALLIQAGVPRRR